MNKRTPIRAKAYTPAEYQPIPIGDLIDRYLKNVNATARSKATYTSYRGSLAIFSYWLEEERDDLETPVTTFTSSESLNDFYIYLDEERGNKQSSIVHHKRQLRTFMYWLMDNNLIEEFPIKIMAAQEEVFKFYTDEELELVTRKPSVTANFSEWRNYIIVLLMLATGNRRATIAAYRIGDFDFNTNTIIMNTTKSKFGQQIPMHPSLKRPLRHYVKAFRSEATKDEPMFPNEFGEFIVANALSHQIAVYNRNRGVKATSMHMYRHTFARNWVRNGGDSIQLQRMLGHATLTMTEKYVRLFREDLVDAVNQFASINTVIGIAEKTNRSKIRSRGAQPKKK